MAPRGLLVDDPIERDLLAGGMVRKRKPRKPEDELALYTGGLSTAFKRAGEQSRRGFQTMASGSEPGLDPFTGVARKLYGLGEVLASPFALLPTQEDYQRVTGDSRLGQAAAYSLANLPMAADPGVGKIPGMLSKAVKQAPKIAGQVAQAGGLLARQGGDGYVRALAAPGAAIESGLNRAGLTAMPEAGQLNTSIVIRKRGGRGYRSYNPTIVDPRSMTRKPAVTVAGDMEAAGASAQEIKLVTNLHRDPVTRRWMGEISDKNAKMLKTPEQLATEVLSAPVLPGLGAYIGPQKGLLDHKELYEITPALQNTPFFGTITSGGGASIGLLNKLSVPMLGEKMLTPYGKTTIGEVLAADGLIPSDYAQQAVRSAPFNQPALLGTLNLTRFSGSQGHNGTFADRIASGAIKDTLGSAGIDYRWNHPNDPDWRNLEIIDPTSLKSTMLHEGAAHGSSMAIRGTIGGAHFQQIYNSLIAQGVPPNVARQRAWDMYSHAADEVYARGTQYRMNLDEDQLRRYYQFHDDPNHPMVVGRDKTPPTEERLHLPESQRYAFDVPLSKFNEGSVAKASEGFWPKGLGFDPKYPYQSAPPSLMVNESQMAPRGPSGRRPSGGGGKTTGFDASAEPSASGLLAQTSINMPAGSDPRYRGAAPNRTTEYQRYVPPRETARVQRLIAAVNDPSHPIHARIDGYIRRGQELGGDDWYNTEEALDWFIAAAGGDKAQGLANWREFMTFMGGTSTGSKVPSNIRNASFYYMLSPRQRRLVAERVAQGGITPGEAARELRLNLPNMPDDYNYGHLMQANHAKNIRGIMDGEWSQQMPEGLSRGEQSKWLQKNPKVKSFGNDLMGAQQNIAADMHYMRILAMSDGGTDFLSKQASLSAENLAAIRQRYGDAIEPYISVRLDRTGKEQIEVNLYKAAEDGVITDTEPFRDTPTAWVDVPNENEYAAVEGLAQRLARNYPMAGPNQPGGRMTAPQFQANLWMGAGDVTGLADESQGTFMELFRRAIDRRAAQLGITREEMFMLFANKQAPLAVAGGVGIGGGLLATQGQQEQDPYAGLMRGY